MCCWEDSASTVRRLKLLDKAAQRPNKGNALSGERAIAEENLASQVHRTLNRAGS